MRFIKILTPIILFLMSGCVLFKPSDLRTLEAEYLDNPSQAQYLLTQMANAHGVKNWKNVMTYTVEFEENYLGKMGAPFPEKNSKLSLQYIPNSFDGRLTFLSGKNEGRTWGIQSWNSYMLDSNQQPVFKKHKKTKFWLPTYQYFIEFPLRIQNANAFDYAGECMIDGVHCDGILASWNTTDPQKKIDQYLIWIDKRTKRIVKLEYTIREVFGFLTGAAYFKDYKDYDGILLPSYMPVETNIKRKGYLHEMRINGFKKNTISKELLRPNPELGAMGDDKS